MSGEQEQSNICRICGGVLRLEYVIEFVEARPHTMRIEPPASKPFRVCFGHSPEQDTMHDGILEPTTGSNVTYHEGYADSRDEPGQGIRIAGRHCDGYHDDVVLMPDEALSLLRWLLQERTRLEELAKEQV